MKNGIKAALFLSWNVVGDSNDETNLSHMLLLTDTQVSRIRKVFQMVYQIRQKFQKHSFLK